MKFSVGVSAFVAAITVASLPAVADDVATVASVQPSAPAVLTRCNVSAFYSSFQASFNLYNRSTHGLSDVSLEYRFFDRDNSQIGEVSYTYTPHDTLSPQDTETLNNNYVTPQLAEPMNSVSRVVCRVTAAHFTGQLAWKTGSTWHGGVLSPIPRNNEQASDASANRQADAATGSDNSAHRAKHVDFAVERAWNEVTTSGGTYVHDALVIHGGDAAATIRPSDFSLTMALANGGEKTYSALSENAPMYQKYSALTGQYTTVPVVDPSLDLGHLGSLIVAPHADAHVIVTFAITDRIADPTANQRVVFR